MSIYPGAQGANILRDLAATIQRNAAYLSELDGAVGDGDHCRRQPTRVRFYRHKCPMPGFHVKHQAVDTLSQLF